MLSTVSMFIIAVLALFAQTTCAAAVAATPLLTNVTIFDPPDAYTVPRTLYARVMAIECDGSNTLLATWENYLPTKNPKKSCPPNCPVNPYMPIYASNDGGKTWEERAKVHDQVNGWGLRYQPFLYEMKETIGDFKAGTLLLAANSIPTKLGQTQIDLYASTDKGYNWKFVSHIAHGGKALPDNQYTPVWEPFILTYDNQLVVYYSDQREPKGPPDTLGQKLVHQTSNDLKNWGPIVDDVHYHNATFRPGMTTISHLPNDKWIITYEFYGAPEEAFAVYYRISDSPLTFDSAPGMPLLPAGGVIPVSSPYNVWTPAGGPHGTIVVSDGTHTQLYLNKKLGDPDAWTQLETPAGISYTRSLLVLPDNPGRIMIAAGGVLGGEDNMVNVTTIDIPGK